MSPGLLEYPGPREAFSDSEWQPQVAPRRRTFNRLAQAPASFVSRPLSIKFGPGVLEFFEQPPSWLRPAIEHIASFGELPANWDSYGAQAIEPHCAAAAINFLLINVGEQIPLPAAVPTSRGGIQLEWHCNGIDIEIEFSSPTKIRFAFDDDHTGVTVEQAIRDDFRPVTEYLQRLTDAGSQRSTP